MKKIVLNPTVLAFTLLAVIFLVVRYTPYFNQLSYRR